MPDDPLEQIRTLYFNTTRSTIDRDIDRAITLLKAMDSDEAREPASVYMEGLVEMRGEWKAAARPRSQARPAPGGSAKKRRP